jgi:hypothetical protein
MTKNAEEKAEEERGRREAPARWTIYDRHNERLKADDSNLLPTLPASAPAELHALAKAADWLGEAIKKGDQIAIGFAVERLDRQARSAAGVAEEYHPWVQEWVSARRSLGDRGALRKLKNKLPGATAGLSPQIVLRDVWLRLAVERVKADSKGPLTIAEIQAQAKALSAKGWLPELMKHGLVHEDSRRMQEGRGRGATDQLIKQARDAREHLGRTIMARLNVTERAFADWLAGLGLYEPRTRRR